MDKNNIKQEYIDLYRENKETLKANSSEILNKNRDAAFERFCVIGLPDKDNEEFKNVNINELFSVNYGLNIRRLPIPVNPRDAFCCDVLGINSYLYFVVNDAFYPANNNTPLPEGVIISGINSVSITNADLPEKYFSKLTNKHKDGITAMNEMFAQDGFFIYVPENVKIDKPIQIVNIMRSDVDFMANSHNLVILEAGAKAQVLVCDHTMDDMKFFENRITEVFVGENADYEHYKIENTSHKNTNFSTLLIEQKEQSKVLANIITLHNGTTHNSICIDLDGEYCETILCGMVVSDKTQNVDNYTVVNHNKPNCHSNELFKYVLDENSVCGFTGKLFVAQDAQKTAAYQTNKNLLLGKEARIRIKPQLEIYADDVKCSHGATTGRLDEEAMFYLRSRGISAREARLLLMYAFTADIVENIKVEGLKERVKMLVEKRLRGEQSKCEDCSICG
jgi:FeS assembly protein SufD